MTDIDTLRAELDAALTGRDGWKQILRRNWESGEFSGPGQLHTVRRLDVQRSINGPVAGPPIVHAQKDNQYGQPCDVQEFTDVADAIAWVETPRSEQPEQHREYMARMEAWDRRPKPQDVACGHCKAEPGQPCTARTGRSLGDDVHAKRKTAWKQARASRVVQTVRLPDEDVAATTAEASR